MSERRLPRPRELAPLVRLKRPELDATKRRLAAAFTIDDLRKIAKRRTPKVAFDYTDGAAEGEISLARARQAFQDVDIETGLGQQHCCCQPPNIPWPIPWPDDERRIASMVLRIASSRRYSSFVS